LEDAAAEEVESGRAIVWCYYSVHVNANAREKRVACEVFLSV